MSNKLKSKTAVEANCGNTLYGKKWTHEEVVDLLKETDSGIQTLKIHDLLLQFTGEKALTSYKKCLGNIHFDGQQWLYESKDSSQLLSNLDVIGYIMLKIQHPDHEFVTTKIVSTTKQEEHGRIPCCKININEHTKLNITQYEVKIDDYVITYRPIQKKIPIIESNITDNKDNSLSNTTQKTNTTSAITPDMLNIYGTLNGPEIFHQLLKKSIILTGTTFTIKCIRPGTLWEHIKIEQLGSTKIQLVGENNNKPIATLEIHDGGEISFENEI